METSSLLKTSPVLQQLKIMKTELAYVTAYNKENRSFFTQLCRFTNAELVQFNVEIHNYCKKVVDNGLKSSYNSSNFQEGEIYCAKYDVDQSWYRVQITKVFPEKRQCEAVFIDYGNVVEFSFNGFLRVDPMELSCIERAPFGIHCRLKDSEKLDAQTANIMLDAINGEYILMKTLEQQRPQEWLVDIPKLAYNSSFWLGYHVARNKFRNKNPGEEVNQQLLTREEMLTAGLDA